jgi:hypothetical protein
LTTRYWVTELGGLGVALGNTHAFLATIANCGQILVGAAWLAAALTVATLA